MRPELFPETQGRRGLGGKRDDLGGMYVRSAWEANWARYLNWLLSVGDIRSWEYEPETFEFPGSRHGNWFYTPDFKVVNKDGSVEYHEIKGYMDDKSKTKLERMRTHYPHINLKLIDQEAYKAIAKHFCRRLPNWEGRVRNG